MSFINDLLNFDFKTIIYNDSCFHHHDLLTGHSGVLCYLAKHLKEFHHGKDFEHLQSIVDFQLQKSNQELSISKGILGIGLCYLYCFQQSGIKNNANLVLEELDNYIFRFCSKHKICTEKDQKRAIEILLYLSQRIKYGYKYNSHIFLYEKMTFQLINEIYSTLKVTSFYEKVPFTLSNHINIYLETLINIASQNIYRTRIQHIFDEICMKYTSVIPYLHSNRLRILVTLLYAEKNLNLGEKYKTYIQLLKSNISLDYIIKKELNGTEFLFLNGICGIYLLAIIANTLNNNSLFSLDKQDIFLQINNSPYYKFIDKDLKKMPIGLNGIAGLKFFIEHLNYEKI